MESQIKALVAPRPVKSLARKVRGIDVELLRLTAVAQTVEGNVNSVSLEAIGAPYRLGTKKDGSIRFTPSGRVVTVIASDLRNFGNTVHDNFVEMIRTDTNRIFREKEDACTSMLATAEKAGKPIIAADEQTLADYLKSVAEPEKVLVPV